MGEMLFGWIDHPARHAIAAQHPTLSQAAPSLMAGEVGDVLLYKAWKDVLGKYPNYVPQGIGDCSSFGTGHGLDLLQCVEIAIGKEPLEYEETCTEALYAIGREIAGLLAYHWPNGAGDGGYCSAVAKGLMTVGAVPRKLVGDYSAQRAADWGWHGAPAEIKAAAAEFKLGGAALITTLAEADAALANGYPVAVSSSWGFTIHRDSTGLCQASGRWDHVMTLTGRRVRNGRVQYCICQSWGTNTGAPGPYGPLADDQPPFSFWIEASALSGMLAAGDSYAFSKFGGFARRALPAPWTFKGFV